MKKIIFIIAFFSFFFIVARSQDSLGQDESSREILASSLSNSIGMSTTAFIFSTFQMRYEKSLNKGRSALVFSPGFILSGGGNNNEKIGVTVETQYKINIAASQKNNNLTIFYAAPYLGIRYIEDKSGYSSSYYDYYTNRYVWYGVPNEYITSIRVGFVMGVKLIKSKRFFIDIFAGGGIQYSRSNKSNSYASITELNYTGVLPRGGFIIGFNY